MAAKLTMLFFLKEPINSKEACVKDLSPEAVNQFRDAIEDNYYFEHVLGMMVQGHS